MCRSELRLSDVELCALIRVAALKLGKSGTEDRDTRNLLLKSIFLIVVQNTRAEVKYSYATKAMKCVVILLL